MSVSVALEGAGKRFTKYEDTPMLVTSALRFRRKTRMAQLWAIRNLDLQVETGSCVGVIGRNGSGKSTTLQMLAGVTAPTEGRVIVRGRVAPLISVGVGFHPELTGRENIFVNGMILGLSRKQIEERLDAIIDFSEISGFIDTPVKFYSSGMFVRLGFSVAIHSEPEVLLVDEVLAVGDLSFQLKCFDRMMEIRSSGTTILVVSHNLNAVRKLCDRTTVLHQGEQRFDGPTEEAISLYHDLLDEHREIDDELDTDDEAPVRRGVLTVGETRLLGGDGRQTGNVTAGDVATFEVDVEFHEDIVDPIVGLSIGNERGVAVYNESTLMHPLGAFRAGERAVLQIALPLRLVTGSYIARIGITDPGDLVSRLGRARPIGFYVAGRRMVTGVSDLEAEFRRRPERAVEPGAPSHLT